MKYVEGLFWWTMALKCTVLKWIYFGVQIAQSRFGVSSQLNIDVIDACANFVLGRVLRDETAPNRLPTLNTGMMEVAALLLWNSPAELVMTAHVWSQCSGGRLSCRRRLHKIHGHTLQSVNSCPNSSSTNVRLDRSTLLKLCSAVKTIHWVRSEYFEAISYYQSRHSLVSPLLSIQINNGRHESC